MKLFGWVDMPDNRVKGDRRTKVILVGHRRIAVAKELGIDWEQYVDWIDFGDGDAADAKRLKLMIASNTGMKTLSPNDLKRLEWSSQKIAEDVDRARQEQKRASRLDE